MLRRYFALCSLKAADTVFPGTALPMSSVKKKSWIQFICSGETLPFLNLAVPESMLISLYTLPLETASVLAMFLDILVFSIDSEGMSC